MSDGRSLPLAGFKQRALLALLLLERDRAVSLDRLIDGLWPEDPPASAENSVQVYISRLRRALDIPQVGPRRLASIATEPAGYVLHLADASVDADDFENLLREGSEALRAADAVRAESALARAIGLWHGPPLADFTFEPFAQAEITRLEELQLRAHEERLHALLELGRHSETVGELQSLAAAHPLEERLRAQLMLALYRSGRQAEALAVYHDFRGLLREELGLDPGVELRELERSILRQEKTLCGSAEARSTPRQTASRDERKLVTVLVAGLVATGEHADPEDLSTLITPVRRRIADEVRRHGGTPMPGLGDLVAAVFGAAVSHEDDAERALRAALAVRDWANEESAVALRLGVDTGETLVAPAGDGPLYEAVVTGEVVNRALALQALAAPRAVVVGERAHSLTDHVIVYRNAPATPANDRRAWEAIRARSPELAARGLTPFVGRERELAWLTSLLDRACETRSPHLVTLLGEPGIGKTRLVDQFQRRIGAARAVAWRQGRSLPYGEGVTFWALAQIVKAEAGIIETDAPSIAGDKLACAVTAVVADAEGAWITSHLRPLIGLGGEKATSSDTRNEAFAAWRGFLQALAERTPLVIVFEDVHWADEGLLDFIDTLIEWTTDAPLLIVATARPELIERRHRLAVGTRQASLLALSPLSEGETVTLLDHLPGFREIAPATREYVLARVAGNALYAEQYARLARERRGLEDMPLPDSVRATIAARLDALPQPEKSLIQSAAVFTKGFWTGAAAAVEGIERRTAEASLYALERKQYVQRSRGSSILGESEYTFAHALLREVAYAQLPRAARADRHERAAAWIESLGRSGEHAELLAHHYLAALDLDRAGAGVGQEVRTRACRAFVEAGERTLALHAYEAAARYFERALEVTASADPGHPLLLLRFATALHRSGDMRAQAMLEAARDALSAAEQRHGVSEAETLLAELWSVRGDDDRAHEHLERALEQLDDAAPEATRARILATAAHLCVLVGEAEAAARHARQALVIAERLGAREVAADILVTLGVARWHLGDREGIADIERGRELAVSANALRAAARSYLNLANVLARDGDPARPQQLLLHSQRVSEQLGDRNGTRLARANIISYDKFLGGQWDEALRLANEFIAECEARSPHKLEHEMRSVRAAIHLGRGDVDEAIDEYELALQRARKTEVGQSLRRQLAENARVYVELGRPGEAIALAREAVASGDSVRPQWAWNVFSLALVAEPLGVADALFALLRRADSDSFEERVLHSILVGELERAADLMAASGRRTREAMLRLRAAESLYERGRVVEARKQLEKTLDFYRSVRATRYIARAESLLSAACDPALSG